MGDGRVAGWSGCGSSFQGLNRLRPRALAQWTCPAVRLAARCHRGPQGAGGRGRVRRPERPAPGQRPPVQAGPTSAPRLFPMRWGCSPGRGHVQAKGAGSRPPSSRSPTAGGAWESERGGRPEGGPTVGAVPSAQRSTTGSRRDGAPAPRSRGAPAARGAAGSSGSVRCDSACSPPSGIAVLGQRLAQAAAAGVDARPDGALVPAQHLGDLGASQVLEEVKHDREAEPVR